MEKAVTFIVRAMVDKPRTIRCLNSLYRQKNKAFRVIAITDIKGFSEELSERYENIECVYVKKKKSYVKAANKCIEKLKTSYFVFVHSDTVFQADAVDVLLSSGKKAVLFNVSGLSGDAFKTVYPQKKEEFGLAACLKNGVGIWNNVFSTEYVKKNALYLKDLDYFSQLMFILRFYSGVESFEAVNTVLAYKTAFPKVKDITYLEFSSNRRELKKIIRCFSRKGMDDVVMQIIRDFVVSNMHVYYEEKNVLKKLHIKLRLKMYFCI